MKQEISSDFAESNRHCTIMQWQWTHNQVATLKTIAQNHNRFTHRGRTWWSLLLTFVHRICGQESQLHKELPRTKSPWDAFLSVSFHVLRDLPWTCRGFYIFKSTRMNMSCLSSWDSFGSIVLAEHCTISCDAERADPPRQIQQLLAFVVQASGDIQESQLCWLFQWHGFFLFHVLSNTQFLHSIGFTGNSLKIGKQWCWESQ